MTSSDIKGGQLETHECALIKQSSQEMMHKHVVLICTQCAILT